MSKMKTVFQVVLFLSVVQVIYGQGCGERNTAAAGRQCQRPCQEDGSCRKQNRECVCDGLCGLSCLKKTCPNLDFGSEGSVTVIPSQRYIGSIATYSCNRGFTLVGNTNRTCRSDKTWSDSEPVCSAVSNEAKTATETHNCSMLPFPANGIVGYYQEIRVEGAVATYRCDDGFTLRGNQNRTCQGNGSWSDTEPVCIEDSCPDISIENGFVRHGHEDINRLSHDGDNITFSCNAGYHLISQEHLTCTNGQWTQRLPVCQDATTGCRRPHINPSVIVHVGEEDIPIGSRQFFTEGEIITSRCDDPRPTLLIGPVRRRCTDEGWTETAPSCEESQLIMGVDNTLLFDFLPDGTFVVFPISGHVWINCRKLSGSPFASSATISTNSSARRRIVQREARLRRLVIYDPTPASSGTYTCRDTNSLSRSINIRFQDIRCTQPDPVSNGRWEHIKAPANEFTPTSYIFKETVRLHCSSGYRVNSSRDSECNYQGRWSPPLASCVAN